MVGKPRRTARSRAAQDTDAPPHAGSSANTASPSRSPEIAHSIADAPGAFLVGQVLIAMPAMTDKRFEQSVIYLCAHSADGAMGIVVNRPLAAPSFDDLLSQLRLEPVPPVRGMRLCAGGPVDNSRGFVLHTSDWCADASLRIDSEVALTASLDILKAVARGGGPKRGFLALGYAGWGAGQLDGELQTSSWLTGPADHDVLFDDKYDTKWRRALACLRVDPVLLSSQVGRA